MKIKKVAVILISLLCIIPMIVKGESIKFNTPEITATFYKRKKDGKWKADFVGLETEQAAKTWFTEVPEPAEAMREE